MYYTNGKKKKRSDRTRQIREKSIGGLRSRRGDPTDHFIPPPKRKEKKILIQEDALALIKNMNQQELVYFLLGIEEM